MSSNNKEVDENEHLHIKPPSLLKMVQNFTKASIAHVSNGMKTVSTDVYTERLDACNSCPFFQNATKRCGKCGCLLEHKAKWESSDCPDTPSRWKNSNSSSDDDVDYPRTGGLSPDTGPRH